MLEGKETEEISTGFQSDTTYQCKPRVKISSGGGHKRAASTSSIVPGSAKERVLMLYFNTNLGATLKGLPCRTCRNNPILGLP